MNNFLSLIMITSLILFFNSCSSDSRNKIEELEIQNMYGKTGFMDQVKSSNTKADCAPEDATKIEDCIQTNGYWKLVIPNIENCKDITIKEKLGLFNWTCSKTTNSISITSTMKSTTSLASFLEPGAFKLNSLIIKDKEGNIIATTKESTWFTDKVQILPVSTSGSEPITLNEAGIYTFGPSSANIISNMIASTKDKTAIVGLQNARLKFNDGCINLGIPGMPDLCSTVVLAGDFNYVEGAFVSPPADETKLNFTVLTGGKLPDFTTLISFVELNNIHIIKNSNGSGWGSPNEPMGVYTQGKFHRVKGTLTGQGLKLLNTSSERNLISANITGGNAHESVLNINGSYNTITGTINISSTDHSPIHMREATNNVISSNIILTNSSFGGLTLNDSHENIFTGNITINNSSLELLNGSSKNNFTGNVTITGGGLSSLCLEISYNDGEGGVGSPSNANNLSGTTTINNCSEAIHIKGSDDNVISGLTNIYDSNVGVSISGESEHNRLTGLNIGPNIGSYDVFFTEDLLLESPTDNEVKSYNLVPFSSCGTPIHVLNNDTSCPTP